MRGLARTLVMVALAALLAPPAAVALAVPAPLSVVSVETAEYPRMTVEVSLPAELANATPTFSVNENGAAAKVVSATPRGATRGPVRAVLVLDVSGSMAGQALGDAKRAARAFIEAMGPDDLVALVAFSDSPRTLTGFTGDKTALLALLDGLRASGETAVYDAVSHTARIAQDASGRTAIVLLSDGGDTVSAGTLDGAVRALKASGAPVYAVALQSKEWDPNALETIARATGGRLLQAKDSGELLGIYRGLASELQATWLVEFESAQPATKDLDLRIEATAGGRSAVGGVAVPNPRFAGPPPTDIGVRPGRPEPALLAAAVVATAASVAMAVMALASLFARKRARLDRLAFYDQAAFETEQRGSHASSGLQARLVDAIGEVAGRRGFTRVLGERLQQAGLSIRPAEFIALHLLVVVTVGVLAEFATGSLAVGVCIGVLAAFVPLALVDSAVRRRREAFEEQLPDVLNLLSGSLRAGWGLLQAIGLVVEQSAAPVSVEFNRVQTEARLGLPVEDALEKMADRLQSEDFRWTVAAIAVQREVGGNLAEVLDIVAATMRERAQTRRQIRSLTAEGRLSAIVLIALPFVELLALLVINPGYVSLLVTTPLGWAMSIAGVVLMTVGVAWLNHTMSVEV